MILVISVIGFELMCLRLFEFHDRINFFNLELHRCFYKHGWRKGRRNTIVFLCLIILLTMWTKEYFALFYHLLLILFCVFSPRSSFKERTMHMPLIFNTRHFFFIKKLIKTKICRASLILSFLFSVKKNNIPIIKNVDYYLKVSHWKALKSFQRYNYRVFSGTNIV